MYKSMQSVLIEDLPLLYQKLGHSAALENQHKRCNSNWKHFACFRVTEKGGSGVSDAMSKKQTKAEL